MAGLIAAIELKRKMYVEFEDAPYHMLEVEVSRPTARGGRGINLVGHHEIMLPLIAAGIIEALAEARG